MSQFYNDSIYWIEVEKINPNPYQPRKEFDEARLRDLSESIRQYGILQPLVVTRKEIEKPDGGLAVEYELIAGERRLRASKLAGLKQVPALIRAVEDDSKTKLELAIIENLQREDLNPVDRAKAFEKLAVEFSFKHTEIAAKIGKSREYVSNTLRLLGLPETILGALSEGRISEGHARPLMMLNDRPEEQTTLFKEIIYKKMTVREAEGVARRIAQDKVRKKEYEYSPEVIEIENRLAETLGTRVQIERKEVGGKIMIDFFSDEDLRSIVDLVKSNKERNPNEMLENYISRTDQAGALKAATGSAVADLASIVVPGIVQEVKSEQFPVVTAPILEEKKEDIVGDTVVVDQIQTEETSTLSTIEQTANTNDTTAIPVASFEPAVENNYSNTPIPVATEPEPMIAKVEQESDVTQNTIVANSEFVESDLTPAPALIESETIATEESAIETLDDRPKMEIDEQNNQDDEMYFVRNFSI